ncbi:fungal hydrophobin [Dendrothele bispora CBS 962.96]|uniref:Hydrophobin n=1 Tax=Dendrothele bispora (strain CBS 962.96) TaxID=1314807 RepID=A0A4S8MVV1_DENBC|nr:fungal hydrophobin [Dendrothele bispora CBS 962.96]
MSFFHHPKPATSSIPASQCNIGSLQCCNAITDISNPAVQVLATLLGRPTLTTSDNLVGLTCDPVTVIGIGGASCSSQLVCCQDNSFNGIIAFGCIPVIII